MNKKYFFFDIDGTLTDGKHLDYVIPQSAIDAIKELRLNGHEVFIATGRPFVAAKEFARVAGIDNIVCNGGYTCYLNGEIIRNKGMCLEDCHHVMQECLTNDIPLIVAESDDFVFHAHNDAFKTIVGDENFLAHVIVDPQLDYFKFSEIYRMMLAIERGGEGIISDYGSLVPSRYHDAYVLIEPDDKYEGILHMMKAINGDEKQIVVFGDGMNDITMFKGAPISIAMDNGVDELKNIATYVTKRSDEDGLAYALKQFGWIT